MEDEKKQPKVTSSSAWEEITSSQGRKARRYMINKETLAVLKKQQKERRRSRRFVINGPILEINGKPGNGAKIMDLSMNGARVHVPFAVPFMSQITMVFSPPDSTTVFTVTGRVIWSKSTFKKGWYEVGVQFYQNYWEIDKFLQVPRKP